MCAIAGMGPQDALAPLAGLLGLELRLLLRIGLREEVRTGLGAECPDSRRHRAILSDLRLSRVVDRVP
jgi:hypothetical protein